MAKNLFKEVDYVSTLTSVDLHYRNRSDLEQKENDNVNLNANSFPLIEFFMIAYDMDFYTFISVH